MLDVGLKGEEKVKGKDKKQWEGKTVETVCERGEMSELHKYS